MKGKPYNKALSLMNRGGAPGKAYPLLVEAMKAGDYRAHYAIGTWYLYGRHVRASVRRAVGLFRQAADHNVAEAAFDLAVCYEKGEGVKQDLPKAAAFYLRALRCGDASAAKELRRMFYWGIGVEKNRAIAEEFLKLSASRKSS